MNRHPKPSDGFDGDWWLTLAVILPCFAAAWFLPGCTVRKVTLTDGTRYESSAFLTSRTVGELEIHRPDGTRLVLKSAKSDVGAAVELAETLAAKVP